MKKKLCPFLTVMVFTISITALPQTSSTEEFVAGSIEWAANDTGAPDCPERYVELNDCLVEGALSGNTRGNRSCVIRKATIAAKHGAPDEAVWGWVLITQCHNADAFQRLVDAGPAMIADYLRRR
jgi:hypothetical protein